jgi:hypothetical protein
VLDAPIRVSFTVNLHRWTLNRKCLSRASLTIGKDSAVVAHEARVCYRLSYLVEELVLLGLLESHIVESECLLLLTAIEQYFLISFDREAKFDLVSRPSGLFPFIDWPNPDHNLDCVFVIWADSRNSSDRGSDAGCARLFA